MRGGPQYDYLIGKYLGSGGFAIVREVICKEGETLQKYAMKIIRKSDNQRRMKMVQNEINIMQTVCNEYIIRLHKTFVTNNYIYLVMEYVRGGDLFKRVTSGSLSAAQCKIIAKEILLGIQYLNSKSIIHRDIKPENILFVNNEDIQIKITDFGLSRRLDSDMRTATTICGSDLYIPPEIINKMYSNIPYDASRVDVWSAGVVFFIMNCGYAPFQIHGGQFIESIRRGIIEYGDDWKDRDPWLIDLISKMLVVDVSKRISVSDCLKHPYFLFDD